MIFDALIHVFQRAIELRQGQILSPPDRKLLRNRIYLSWFLWAIAAVLLVSPFTDYLTSDAFDFCLVAGLVVLGVSRVMRSLKRPRFNPFVRKMTFFIFSYAVYVSVLIFLIMRPPLSELAWVPFAALFLGILPILFLELRKDFVLLRLIRQLDNQGE